tara:strand:+ start:26 stop:259 length:234 start_codon:yes stop_codon:yes gene_type:complete
MLNISNIPQAVYAVALDYMLADRADDGDHKAKYWAIVTDRGWTESELEQAISDYLLRKESFADDQEFESESGYERGD